MKLIAVTGGIATGKSTAAGLLARELDCPFCSCDALVHDLLRKSRVAEWIERMFPNTVSPKGEVNRRLLASRVFASVVDRRKLESFLHPLVLESIAHWAESYESGTLLGLVEVPLLYEVDFPLKRDVDVVVACSERTQIERLTRREGIPERVGERIAAQMPIPDKIFRAEVVIWNDGSLGTLSRLVVLAARRIHQKMQ